jgi:YCII-related domain
MRSVILLYKGPATPPGASHEAWPEWFESLGDKLVDLGSPMANGFVIHSDGTTSETASSLNGYSVIRVQDEDEARELVKHHPFLALGPDYTIEVFDVPRK